VIGESLVPRRSRDRSVCRCVLISSMVQEVSCLMGILNSFSEVTSPDHGADHWLPFSVKVKNVQNFVTMTTIQSLYSYDVYILKLYLLDIHKVSRHYSMLKGSVESYQTPFRYCHVTHVRYLWRIWKIQKFRWKRHVRLTWLYGFCFFCSNKKKNFHESHNYLLTLDTYQNTYPLHVHSKQSSHFQASL
jgi:hypothetical protein